MVFLKKENWVLSLIMTILSQGLFCVVLAYFLGIYQTDAWYKKWQYWLVPALFMFFPIFLVLMVFLVQISCQVAEKLNVPGASIYANPYSWILCIVVPVIGWILLLVMLVYVLIWPIVMIYKGEGEQYAS